MLLALRRSLINLLVLRASFVCYVDVLSQNHIEMLESTRCRRHFSVRVNGGLIHVDIVNYWTALSLRLLMGSVLFVGLRVVLVLCECGRLRLLVVLDPRILLQR